VIACIEDPVVMPKALAALAGQALKQILDHLKRKAVTSEPGPLPESRAPPAGLPRGCLTDEPKSQWFQSSCCAHTDAAGIRRAGWGDVTGYGEKVSVFTAT